MTVSSPADSSSTKNTKVQVRGSVVPADATVRIAGKTARNDNGLFSVTVPLKRGENELDVEASVPPLSPYQSTLTITRKRTQAEIAKAKAARERRVAAKRAARAEARRAREAARLAKRRADDYPAADRQAFMSACTIDSDESDCACVLEHMEQEMTYQQYLQADAIATSNGTIPERVQLIYANCASGQYR